MIISSEQKASLYESDGQYVGTGGIEKIHRKLQVSWCHLSLTMWNLKI